MIGFNLIIQIGYGVIFIFFRYESEFKNSKKIPSFKEGIFLELVSKPSIGSKVAAE
jgi:hypothetical protein